MLETKEKQPQAVPGKVVDISVEDADLDSLADSGYESLDIKKWHRNDDDDEHIILKKSLNLLNPDLGLIMVRKK